jgi:hypothetical protein
VWWRVESEPCYFVSRDHELSVYFILLFSGLSSGFRPFPLKFRPYWFVSVHPYFPFPFSEPNPVSANKYRNGNRNGVFPSVFNPIYPIFLSSRSHTERGGSLPHSASSWTGKGTYEMVVAFSVDLVDARGAQLS